MNDDEWKVEVRLCGAGSQGLPWAAAGNDFGIAKIIYRGKAAGGASGARVVSPPGSEGGLGGEVGSGRLR